MRPLLILAPLALLGCANHNFIGPDDAGKTPDGSVSPDGSALPDGSTSPDGSAPDGGNPKSDQGYTAGSRLKVKYYEGADGSEQAIGFYDTQLNQDCSFYMASDSTFRCMNLGASAMTFVYTDSGCTNPIVYVPKGCTPPATAWTYNAASCSTTLYSVYSLGAAFTGTSAWTGTPQSCSAYSSASLTSLRVSYDLYTLGSQIAPSNYVQATTAVK